MRIMFFENLIEVYQTERFQNELKLELPNIKFELAGTVSVFEDHLKNQHFNAFILDILTIECDIRNFKTKEIVDKRDVGIELLKRIKDGNYYKNQSNQSIVIMRSARAIEPAVRSTCKREGARYVFRPGKDDQKIIHILKKLYPPKKLQRNLPFDHDL